MNRKTLIIAGGVAAGGALVAGGIALAVGLQPADPGAGYLASSLHEVRIVQQGAHSYDVSFTLPDETDTDHLAVQFTDTPDYRADATTDVEYIVEDSRVQLATAELDAGDHFLWVITDDGQTSATVTIPDMAPRVWIDNDRPHIEFDQAGDSSWSSYVDPEGKSVYRSASAEFDDSAEPLAEGLAITETSYRVDNPSHDAPYYFLVFTGHGGDSTFVSSPLFASAEQGQLAVEVRNVDSAPTYVISGFLGARKADDVERTARLRVGSYDANNPASTFFVENTAQDAETLETGRFRFEVAARDLAQGYSDLAVFLTEDGATLEWSLDATGVDMTQRVVDGRSVFGLRRAEALQLTRLDLPYERLQVTLAGSGTSAALRVSGTFHAEAAAVGYQLVVKDATGESHTARDRASTARDFFYSVDLAQLDQASVWYDVEFLDVTTGTSVPISTLSVADMRQWVATDSRTYAFADYDGLLKVFFDASPFSNSHVELATINGVPSLVATGQLIGTANSDASLRISTGGTVVQDVANTSPTRGAFRFVFNLEALPTPGTWFDVTFRKVSTDTLRDFPTWAANLGQTLSAGSRSYSFHDWEGQLKVAYEAVPGTVQVSNVALVDKGGVPTLQVDGALDRLTASDARLRIRTGSFTFDVPATPISAGDVRFDVDLSRLTDAGTWYDVLVGSAASGAFADVPTTGVDMSQALTLGGRLYELHDWDGQLKAAFSDVSKNISVSGAEIIERDGTPILRVTGAVAGTSNADTFLRVRGIHPANLALGTGNVAALTFDDGPNGSDTAELLDYLKAKNIKAVFCVIGDNIQAPGGAELLRRIVAEGHTLCNHTTSYADLGSWTADEVRAELLENLGIIRDALGDPNAQVPFFRAPNGSWGQSPAVAVELGMQPLGVSNTINDWYTQDQATLEANLRAAMKPGEIVVAHDGGGSRAGTVAAVKTVVDERLAAGWSFTLPVGAPEASGGPAFVNYVDVPNTADAEGDALFEYDLSGLLQPGAWYDVLAGVTSSGTLTDLSDDVADLSDSVILGGRTYGFREWNHDLKVTFDTTPIVVTPEAAELVDLDGTSTLRVTAQYAGTSSTDLFLRVRSGTEVTDVPNSSGVSGEAVFEYPLSGLTRAGTWYDLLMGVTSASQLTDLTPAVADMDQTLASGARQYAFRQWAGDLKVTFSDDTPTAALTSVEMVDVGGSPTLRVIGTVEHTTNDDAFLRIRSGSEVIDVPNTAVAAGDVLFEYDVSGLAKPSTWYDLLVGMTSVNSLTELPSSLADLGATINIDARTYAFHEWYGALKVAFENVTLGEGESIRVDFGPDDITNGHATVGPDVNGNYWNNITQQGGASNAVPNGRSISTLVTTDNVQTTTGLTIADSKWRSNGIVTGGLTSPSSVLLGEYAVPTVTEDYFFVQSSGTATLTLSGLDRWREYDLRMFGTRGASDVRKTTYTVTGAKGSKQALLQTSGTGTGTGGYNGNNDTIVTIEDMQPNADGTLTVSITATAGTFGYLGFLEITGDTALTPVPAEVQRWVDQDAADPVADDSVLFIGSSSIRRWETLTRDFADYNVIQRGWGGSWLTGVNDYSPWVAWPYQPRAIVMWAGTNDINGGQSAEHVLNEYRKFVTNMHTNSPGTELLWISMTPNFGNIDKDDVRTAANALIKAEIDADSTGTLHYVDLATSFEQVRDTDPDLFASFYVDNLHLTRLGYAKWLEVVRPALEAVVAPNKAVTSNPATLQPGEKLFFDFGPSNASEGTPTNVDSNGNHWNNWVSTTGGGLVNAGEHIAGLVDSTGRGTGIGMTIASGFQVNGKTTGGLLAPDAGKLGELGIATATEDFFYSSADGKWGGSDDDLPGGLMMSGLDPAKEYEFRFFGSRSASDTRVTEYQVIGANSGSAELQTSGAGISQDGTKNGNDSEIAIVSGIRPDAFGQVWIDLTVMQGSYAYLNAMEVVAGAPAPSGFAARSLVAAPEESAAADDAADGEDAAVQNGAGEATGAAEESADETPAPKAPVSPSDAPSDPAVVPGGNAPSRTQRSSGPRDAGGRRAR